MATTAIWPVKDNLKRVIRYVTNSGKTDRQYYVTGLNCLTAFAHEQMEQTKQRFGKTDSILAYHGYQSFAYGEATPEQAHEIGVKAAQELWGDRFEVVVTTHLDHENRLHNHFVLNSVSFKDGKRYYDQKATYWQMRKTSDKYCREYGLSVITNPQGRGKHYAEWREETQNQTTWRSLVRGDIDGAISASPTYTQFIATLKAMGYDVKTNVKYTAVKPPGKERYIRLKSLGSRYTEEAITQRILNPKPPYIPKPRPLSHKMKYKGPYPPRSARGFRALYYHYCYKMGALKKKPAKRPAFLLRQDLRRLDDMQRQINVLHKNKIDTTGQLRQHAEALTLRLDTLVTERGGLYVRLHRCKDEAEKQLYEAGINELTGKIKHIRAELRACSSIEDRAAEMAENLCRAAQLEAEARQAEKEREKYEPRSVRRR